MKLQNMTVIFIIIMIPIIIVVSYYIGLQINTIKMQKDYDVKLQTAAQDSIQALEINTVEWNSDSYNLADSKRRDILAAVNTFTTSLANSMGIGGAGQGRIQTYIPAIVYTMYDGYYIYSASPMREQQKDENGLTQFETNGDILTNETTSYQYVLKPYSPYSARYVKTDKGIDVTVNYTLDNYIKVYGTVGGEYQTKEGYLVVCDDPEGIYDVNKNSITGIKYRGAEVVPETLKEQVYYIDEEGNNHVVEYPYIYDQYDNKLYYDSSNENYFSINKNNQKVYLQSAINEGEAGFSIYNRFRKISLPCEDATGKLTVLKIFQILNPGGNNKLYYEDERGVYTKFDDASGILSSVTKEKDCSAINYCVESYVFTQWVNKYLEDIKVEDMQSPKGGQYNNVDSTTPIFEITRDNNPDPENDSAYATSPLAQHKKDVIINTIEKNLSQATAQAKEMNLNYEYRLPQLKYEEWEQALSNISIIAFMQGMPIGLKYYNNYAIATSTLNKEYVDPDEIYFSGTGDQYYHQRECEQAKKSNYIGYRSIDYVAKSYEKTEYYYPHSELECYYCLVNRSTYKKGANANWTDPYKNWTDSYYNALARERYMQLDEPGTYRPKITITKTASAGTVEYGNPIEYTIEIKNEGVVKEEVALIDNLASGKLKDIEIIENKLGTNNIYKGEHLQVTDPITINPGETKYLKYKAKPTGTLGENITNTAIVSSFANGFEYGEAEATTILKKTINIATTKTDSTNKYNIIMVLDNSWSLGTIMVPKIKSIAQKFTNDLITQKNVSIKYVKFSFNAQKIDKLDGINGYNPITLGGTNYQEALVKAIDCIEEDANNIVVFMSDGCPTPANLFGGLVEVPVLGEALGLVNTIATGWLELVWKGQDSYGFQLAITGNITWSDYMDGFSETIKKLVERLPEGKLDSWIEEQIRKWAEDGNKGAILSKDVWEGIMNLVGQLKGEYKVSDFHTVYFNWGNDTAPIYGLQQMATDEAHFSEQKNLTELENYFSNLANSIIPTTTETTTEEYWSEEIVLQSGIKEIKINDTSVDNINDYIFDNGNGTCRLNISNWLNDKIEIIY